MSLRTCAFLLLCLSLSAYCEADQPFPMRSFTLADDIGLTKFDGLIASPQGNLTLVRTDSASIADGRMHDCLRVYDTALIRRLQRLHRLADEVKPIWTIEKEAMDAGNGRERIASIRWLSNGTAFAFLWLRDPNHNQLLLADVQTRQIAALTPPEDDVAGFDIRDRYHYVYTVTSQPSEKELEVELQAPERIGTDQTLAQLAFGSDLTHNILRSELWANTGKGPRRILDPGTKQTLIVFGAGSDSLSMAPNGREVALLQPVAAISEDWVKRYPPPFPESLQKTSVRTQDLSAPSDMRLYISQWVLIGLQSGTITALTHAPEAGRSGWFESYVHRASWSDDGSSIILPGSFSASIQNENQRPCVLAIQIKAATTQCIRPLKRNLGNGHEPGWKPIREIRFAPGRNDQVSIVQSSGPTEGRQWTTYRRDPSNAWQIEEQGTDKAPEAETLRVEQSYSDPPKLVAVDSRTGQSQVILDLDPQLRSIARGPAELFDWHDEKGRSWQGILYKPVGFRLGIRYPLVIQTHGFSADTFMPSGGFTSAFAAEEFASAGIMTLQVRECEGGGTPEEGPCAVAAYESAISTLADKGWVDPANIGIIGFSRTVFYTLEALTTSKLHFKAASISDGIMLGYLDYLICVNFPIDINSEAETMIGGKPFGEGLNKWMDRSPVFHLDRLSTPLRVVARRDFGVVAMWEPFALLKSMGKPVDLVVLNTQEHVIVDPRIRKLAQGGNVDWFRFWLQGYEDPDPAKRAQYLRWHRLKETAPKQE